MISLSKQPPITGIMCAHMCRYVRRCCSVRRFQPVPSERSNTRRLRAIKTIHTAIWATVEAAVGYLIFSGITNRKGRLVTVSAALVVAETTIFTVNGFTCPLTQLAESAGADSGSVTDLYLPRWLDQNLPAIHIPLAVVILYLHRHRFRATP